MHPSEKNLSAHNQLRCFWQSASSILYKPNRISNCVPVPGKKHWSWLFQNAASWSCDITMFPSKETPRTSKAASKSNLSDIDYNLTTWEGWTRRYAIKYSGHSFTGVPCLRVGSEETGSGAGCALESCDLACTAHWMQNVRQVEVRTWIKMHQSDVWCSHLTSSTSIFPTTWARMVSFYYHVGRKSTSHITIHIY